MPPAAKDRQSKRREASVGTHLPALMRQMKEKEMKTSFGTKDNPIKRKAGTYRLGDPCYSVPHSRWMEWLEKADYTKENNLNADLDDNMIVGLRTAYGDGVYYDQDGHTYGVDSGMIGLVPSVLPNIQKWDSDPENSGIYRVVTFWEDFKVWAEDDGTLHFGHIEIPTGDEPYDEDDYL